MKRLHSPLGVLFGFALLFSLLESTMIYLSARDVKQPVSWWAEALPRGALNWTLWAGLTVIIYQVVRLFLKKELPVALHLLIHGPISVGFVSLYIGLNVSCSLLWEQMSLWEQGSNPMEDATFREFREPFWEYSKVLFFTQSVAQLSIYSGITAACYAFQYYRPALRSSRLEVRLSQAKLEALQMQLHPHFLFNTLNSVSVLVHKDPVAAERMITRLSDLLRLTLSMGDRQEIPLREELEFLEKYVQIELVRFQDRLRVTKQIDQEVLDVPVPAMILQPLVENSIRHGISRRAGVGQILVRAGRVDDHLVLEVVDDGPGLKGREPSHAIGHGVGLSNTEERLKQLYGENQAFEVREPESGGFLVRISVPFRQNVRLNPKPSA